MNNPINSTQGICIRLSMSDLVKEAIETDGTKKSVVLYIVPRSGQPAGATHAVYQGIRERKGSEHPHVGHARFYISSAIPTDLPL
jgi:hypothetical protein